MDKPEHASQKRKQHLTEVSSEDKAIPLRAFFVGRVEELHWLAERIYRRSAPARIIVTGSSRVGKTTVIIY